MEHQPDSEAIVWFVLCHGRDSSPTVDAGALHLRNYHRYTDICRVSGELFRLDYLPLAHELAHQS